MDDAQIIALYFDRSEAAIEETDKKYGKVCLRLSENILGNVRDAEECVNDTYLGAWNAIPPARPHPLVTFLLKITRNLSLKRYHANTAAKRNCCYDTAYEELECCLGTDPLQEHMGSRSLTQCIEQFLGVQTVQNRVIFLRRYWFADSYAQIARRTGLTEKVVSMRLVRMREKLREALRKEGICI